MGIMHTIVLALITAAAVFGVAAPTEAAVLLVNGSGQLTGATGVVVDGAAYDVQFVEGTCTDRFSGCETTSDLTFQTALAAYFAAQALLEEVLIDGSAGDFDTHYELTLGCSTNETLGCHVLIPYAAGGGEVTLAEAFNTNAALGDVPNQLVLARSYDTTQRPQYVYALFTPAAGGVPEPSTWAMMLLGFGAIGFSVRRQRKVSSHVTA
jgi:hypothetical protein